MLCSKSVSAGLTGKQKRNFKYKICRV